MLAPATSHESVLLNDGRVLIVGGEPRTYAWPVPWTQLYDPRAATWTFAADLHVGRIGETVTPLRDGRVLVAGGLGPNLKRLASAEVFHPDDGTWSLAAPMPQTRFSHSASLMPDGRVLVVGGIAGLHISRTTLFYDPSADRWSRGPNTHGLHAQQSSVTLQDGRVLVAGGYGGASEIFNPRSGSWTVAGPTPPRSHPIMTQLPDGTVLLASGVSAQERDLKLARVFNPVEGKWLRTGSLHTRRDAATGTLLPTGEVLVAGGEQVTENVLSSAELYDPTSHSWSNTAPMLVPRDAATANLLPDDTVLICGGMNFGGVLSSCELYHP